jgi:prophage regulatory protein
VRLLRLPGLLEKRGKSRSAHYDDVQKGLFTPPVNIGPRAVAWPDHEAEALVAAQIAGKSADEIKQLVKKLVAQRATLA